MFSKPLFKQSIKANFTRWIIVTFASCFIVAVVILILGNLNVNKIRGSLEDLFEDSDKQADIQYKSADSYQKTYDVYTKTLDKYKEMTDILERAISGEANEEEYADFSEEFKDAIKKIRDGETEIASSKSKLSSGESELASRKSTYNSSKTEAESQKTELQSTQKQLEEGIAKSEKEMSELKENLNTVNAGITQINQSYEQADEQTKTALDAQLKDLKDKKAQLEAGISQYETGISEAKTNLEKVKSGIGTIDTKLSQGQSQIRAAEKKISTSKSALSSAKSTLASSKEELKTKTLESLYDKIVDGVYDEAIKDNDEETAQKSKELAKEILDKYKNGENTNEEEIQKMAKNYVTNSVYEEAIKENSEEDSKTARDIASTAIDDYNNKIENGATKEEALDSISKSLIEQLPDDVEDAILEIKDLDVYGLVVGNILFRIAGLLLPMIFVIMTANGLLAGQVDSGSMAYILSTPTKRSKVTITQMIYLILAVLLMYVCICTTSVVCMEIIKDSEITITIEEMIKFNIGAFFVMFAVSGICYLSSAIFNREKNSISVGGGLTMFFLVCSILGLFGEKVIPSAIRIEAMNYFNYASIISFFNVNSMLNGTNDYMVGLAILFAIGIVTYIIGIIKFDKKDLPL